MKTWPFYNKLFLIPIPGSLKSSVGHAGDLGNVIADEHGEVKFHILAKRFQLRNVLGRGFVLHAGEDDLGLGGDAESLITGNAGARLACCVIGVAPLSDWRFRRINDVASNNQ